MNTLFLEKMFSALYFELRVHFLLKTVIYNIIEQHENQEMALTYDKYTNRKKNAMHRRCRRFVQRIFAPQIKKEILSFKKNIK